MIIMMIMMMMMMLMRHESAGLHNMYHIVCELVAKQKPYDIEYLCV